MDYFASSTLGKLLIHLENQINPQETCVREAGYISACLTRLLKYTREFFHDTSSTVSIF